VQRGVGTSSVGGASYGGSVNFASVGPADKPRLEAQAGGGSWGSARGTLAQNHPNPFNPSTAIRFELSREADVTLAVYDVSGAEVTRIAEGRYPAGSHEVRWNGVDARGNRAASGVYFYRLLSENTDLTRKMVLLK